MMGSRNQEGLQSHEIQRYINIWEFLCGSKLRPFDTSKAHLFASETYFEQNSQIVYLGANVKPGTGYDANSRLSELACLAHELAHAERFDLGFDRPHTFPELLTDEAETSLHASYISVLSSKDREDLIEDARDRLIQLSEIFQARKKENDN